MVREQVRLVKPFRIAVEDPVLEDLVARLHMTRWPEAATIDDWSQGVPLAWLQELCAYWATSYDWRARERHLNRVAQFTTPLDGLDIHFLHARSPHADALPLVLTHGWPGSVFEFDKVIGPLTDPTAHGGNASDAFHLVCPTLPGFGFSEKPRTPGWGVDRIAAAWAQLMGRLGYTRYGAQGGDWGSAITAALGAQDPEHCVAIQITLAMNSVPPPGREPDASEREALARLEHYREWDSGYAKQQSTRPQTLGYGLTDSPAGQAAWILEKFRAWADCEGDLESVISRDELLDNVTLYWVTRTAASSARLYWENFTHPRLARPVPVPTGVAVYPQEIVPPVRAWMTQRFPDIRRWVQMPRGGHFAALEQPELFVADLREFFRAFRQTPPAT